LLTKLKKEYLLKFINLAKKETTKKKI